MTIHTTIQWLLSSDAPLVQRVGRTLIHSVWQGLAAAAGLRLALLFARRSAGGRYALAVAALACMPLAAVVTFARVGPRAPAPARMVATAPPSWIDTPTATTPAAPQPAAAPLTSATAVVVLLWAVGFTAQVAWHLAGWTRVRRLGLEPPTTDARWTAALATAARRLGIDRPVRLLASARVDVPVVVGVLRPAVVVPVSLLTELSPEHIAAVLVHELAHVRRQDYLVNLIQCGVEAALFYHPAVWWMSAVVRREREHCCDDVAAAVVGDRRAYAATLVALESRRRPSPRLALAATGGSLAGRVRRLVGVRSGPAAVPAAAALVTAAAVGLAAAMCCRTAAPARAQSRPAGTVPVIATAPSSAEQVLAILNRERVSVDGDLREARRTKGDEHPDVIRLRRRRDDIDARMADLKIDVGYGGGTVSAPAATPTANAAAAPPASHVHVTVGRDGFIAVDGGVGDWVTVRDRLARLPAAARAAAVVDLVAESDDVPVGDLFRAEAEMGRATNEAGGGRLEVGSVEAGPVPAEGEAYIGGDVRRVGVYSVSHRRITVKQLVVSAGGLADAADRIRVTIYRRSAGGREVLSSARLADILSGTVPDTYIQPYDVIMVSKTDPATRP